MTDPNTPRGTAFQAHETAIVERGAEIGAGTHIWHHAHVRAGAFVGRDCNLGKNVYIDAGAIIGDRVKIQNNVSVYVGITIEDDVFVGPSAVFTNDLFPRAGSGHWEVGTTVVRRGASIGANATIVCGIEIGEWSLVGAGAVVAESVEPNEMVAGNPSRRIGWVCRCGRRASRVHERPADLRCSSCTDTDQVT